MAALVISAIGASIGGSLISGTILGLTGAQIGNLAGSLIGDALFGGGGQNTNIEGQKLSDLKVQVSTYGNMLAKVYGVNRISGNIIWSTDIKETQHTDTQSQGKGAGGGSVTSTTYTYSVSFQVALCEGKINSIGRIWANGKLIYTGVEAVPVRFYLGDETQLADPLIEATEGVGNVPAYRGTAYAVFENLELAQFGNQIPNLTFEVFSTNTIAPIIKKDYQGFKFVKGYPDQENILAVRHNGVLTDSWSVASINIITDQITILVDDFKSGTGVQSIGGFDTAYVGTVYYSELFLPLFLNEIWVAINSNLAYIDAGIFVLDGTTGAFKGVRKLVNQTNATHHLVQIDYDSALQAFIIPCTDFGAANVRKVILYYPFYLIGTDVLTGIKNYGPYDVNGIDYFFLNNIQTGQYCIASNHNYVKPHTYFLRHSITASNTLIYYDIVSFTGTSIGLITGNIACVKNNTESLWDSKRKRFVIFSMDDAATIMNMRCIPMVDDVYDASLVTNATVSAMPGRLSFLQTAYYLPAQDRYLVFCDTGTNIIQVVIDPVTNTVEKYPINNTAGKIINDLFYDSSTHYTTIGTGALALSLSDFTYIIPLRGSISTGSSDLADIVQSLCLNATLTVNDIDVTQLIGTNVTGFAISQVNSARSGIESLMAAYYFDAVESSSKIKFVKRGSGAYTVIDFNDMAAHESGQEMPVAIEMTRAQELELPKEVNITYTDPDFDFQQVTQKSQRMVGYGTGVLNIPMAIVMKAAKAHEVADVNLFNYWSVRNSFSITISRKYAYLEPTDIIAFYYAGNFRYARITDKSEGSPGLLKLKLANEDLNVYSQSGIAGASNGYLPQIIVQVNGATIGYFLDIPMLRDSDDNAGFYYTAVGATSNWSGVSLFKSEDGGASYASTLALFNAPTIGVATSALPNYLGGNSFDESSALEVTLSHGELSSITELAVLNGGNLALIGKEIIQFKNALLIGTNKYRLTGLLRGRRGTNQHIATHTAYENFIIPSITNWRRLVENSSRIGLLSYYKSVSFGRTLGETDVTPFTNTAQGLECYSPVGIGGGKLSDGSVQINWLRRTRIGGEWRDAVDASLAQVSEAYEVDILNSKGVVLRTLSGLSTTTANYSAANIAIDFSAGLPNPLLVNVYQLSDIVGRGFAGKGTVFNADTPVYGDSKQWRLLITSADGGANLSIAEFALFVDYFDGTTECVNGTPTASAGIPDNAFDGNLATNWTVAASAADTLQYTFSTKKNIRRYSITAPAISLTFAPKNWQLQWLKAGWETVHTVTNQTAWTANEKRTFIF